MKILCVEEGWRGGEGAECSTSFGLAVWRHLVVFWALGEIERALSKDATAGVEFSSIILDGRLLFYLYPKSLFLFVFIR